ncbi:phosphotransferase family protein [Glaciimonas immobilis]|uniref:Aminoglycoside phosphotransferase (APT) family kinase protein n=1 Tax=Glaciimonas immobilis TaxID=728004 RepID=A0A840RSR7_9BURK|nr:phosphotransferase family protein [Glaciimonas immobilis]KAF3997843.1 phosphotransferase family protein [Glaciimonas immobilis]MBB5199519.1 aminoglycoside phosphotransferase (APT) family kinase protein [Glaciimonas immobilis]
MTLSNQPLVEGHKSPTFCGEINEARGPLKIYIQSITAATDLNIQQLERLSGGAIQENWLLVVEIIGGPYDGTQRWVLRTDALSSVPVSLSRAQEFAVLRVAHQAGVKAPKVLWCCEDKSIIGRDFFLMECVSGVAAGHRVTGDDALVPDRPALAAELGANMARLHTIHPPNADLAFLPPPVAHPALASVAAYRGYLDTLNASAPVLEWGLRWCERNSPAAAPVCLLHRDYRTGNYMVHEGKLSGLLDWEFTGWGDPHEDIGWFAARCWRFAAPQREAGGIGDIDDFLRGYASVSDLTITRDDLIFWQVMAHLRWAIIALQQADRHLSGQQTSLELALTGRMLPELEYEILSLTRGGNE